MSTPIEDGLSLGPKSGAALRAAGIESVEALREVGWEEALIRVAERDPKWINANMAAGLIAAVEGVDWRTLSAAQKAKAKRVCERLRRDLG